jgi:hypothetical protein
MASRQLGPPEGTHLGISIIKSIVALSLPPIHAYGSPTTLRRASLPASDARRRFLWLTDGPPGLSGRSHERFVEWKFRRWSYDRILRHWWPKLRKRSHARHVLNLNRAASRRERCIHLQTFLCKCVFAAYVCWKMGSEKPKRHCVTRKCACLHECKRQLRLMDARKTFVVPCHHDVYTGDIWSIS